MSVEKLKVLKLMPDAELPTYGTPGAADRRLCGLLCGGLDACCEDNRT